MVRIAPDGSYAPALADSWETNDSKTWVYHLNKSATWQDGVPVTSKDVSFTISYIKEKFKSFSDVDSVSTPDDHTVAITLKSPNANYLMSNMARSPTWSAAATAGYRTRASCRKAACTTWTRRRLRIT